ncbi:hypothetical protein AAVH_11232 [Aphelenchoides avenae]|nr:hypothetical protein AAVH_11230 [Aphelenchus avenae]KAH7721269.1 hypothetical protein AAVH_11232 [Aphelenchus avenae]
MKTVKGTTYVSFSSHDEAKNAVEKLGGASIKNRKLQVRFTAEEPQTPANTASMEPPKSSKELVTPLANKPYEEQLKQKHEDSS